MTAQAEKPKSTEEFQKEIERLERLLEEEKNLRQEAQETIEAIRTGAVDGIVRSTAEGEQVFILKGSDQPYRNLIEKMNEGAILLSDSGVILYCNMGFAGLVDAPLDSIMGTDIRHWVSARTVEVLNDIIESNGENSHRVFEIAFQDTKQKLVPTQVSISKISLDSINALALIITDLSKHMKEDVKRYTDDLEQEITQRKKAEDALKKSREMEYLQHKELEALMETVPATIWISHDPECLNMTGNKATYDLVGLPKSANVSETAPEDQRPANFLAYDTQGKPIPPSDLPMQVAARTGKSVFNSEFEFRFEDGRSVWVYGNVTPLRDAQGNPQGAVGAYVDITERKKTEEKISWLASFQELNPDPVVEVDFNGKVIYSNPAAKNLFPDLESLGINHPFIFHINTALPILREHSDKIVSLEILACNHWYTQRMYLVPDSSVVRIFGANIDGRKKVEQALMKAREELGKYATQMETLARERAEKLKDSERLAAIGQVAGMVGHDIRNPLQAIVSELYCAKQSFTESKAREDKETVESLDFIQAQVDYINKIVADLQDFARPLKPEFTDVDLCDFIVDALKGFSIPDGIEAGLTCEKRLPPIRLDRTFMTRILTNLATNSIQAMPKGGKLTVKVSRADKEVIIVVEDTGVGIPDEIKSKMFTPMFTTKAKGQGFGLAVVKRLVEAQGGTIAFESKVGKGTKFFITLPLNR